MILAEELRARCVKASFRPEWDRLLRDLVRPQTAVIAKDNTRTSERTPVTRNVGSVFRAVGAAQPLNIAETLSLRHRWGTPPSLWCQAPRADANHL